MFVHYGRKKWVINSIVKQNLINKTIYSILFLCLLFGYFTYNAVFLSELSDPNGSGLQNSNTLYINLLSIYIVWIGMMITILIESSSPYLAKQFLEKGRKKLKIKV